MLVQAKVLDDQERRYEHLDRKIGNSSTRQIDRLILASRHRKVPAIYALYNHVSKTSRIPLQACSCFKCPDCWGISVALADAVRLILPNKAFDRISKVSIPLPCLACPSRFEGEDLSTLPEFALHLLQQLRGRSFEGVKGEKRSAVDAIPIPGAPETSPPSYFGLANEILSKKRGSRRDALLLRIAEENPGVDGVVLISGTGSTA
jgi:hypothetical protein